MPEGVVAGGVNAVLSRRLARLPESVMPLLYVAAVKGRQLDMPVLAYIQANYYTDSPHIDEWLLTGVNGAVLDVAEQSMRFAHDKLRESVLAMLSSADLQRVNHEVATAIEAVYPGETELRAAVLAKHWRAADDVEREAHYLQIVGEGQLQTSAFQDALATVQRYAQLKRAFQTSDVLYGLARAQHGLGNNDVAVVHLKRARHLAAAAGDTVNIARVQAMLANVLWQLGRYAQAKTAAQQARDAAVATGNTLIEADVLAVLGAITALTALPSASQPLYEEALAIYRNGDHQKGVAETYNRLGTNALAMGLAENAETYFTQSAELCEAMGDRFGWLAANNNIAALHLIQGQLTDAYHRYGESRGLAKRIGAQYPYGVATQQAG
ncbi:MAG: hypothetical protein AAF125_00660, partial [Chloroflexota bacterium]